MIMESKDLKKIFTPEEIEAIRKKKWNEMTQEEKRASLPDKLSKAGEWMLSEKGQRGYFEIRDWDAVLQ